MSETNGPAPSTEADAQRLREAEEVWYDCAMSSHPLGHNIGIDPPAPLSSEERRKGLLPNESGF